MAELDKKQDNQQEPLELAAAKTRLLKHPDQVLQSFTKRIRFLALDQSEPNPLGFFAYFIILNSCL